MEIRQPIDDHAVVSITYLDGRFHDIGRCDLSSRNWLGLKSEIIDEVYGSRLVRYDGMNKLNQPEIAFVAVSGIDDSIHGCTVIDYEDVWVSNKDIAFQIINSVRLSK